MTRNAGLIALTAVVALAGCRAGMREIARDGAIGTTELVGIKSDHETLWAAVRYIKTPSQGMLYVVAEPQIPGQNLEISVLPPTGGALPLAKGPSPVESPKLPAGMYAVVVQAAPGMKVATRANLQVLFKPENPDENSEDDHKKDRAAKLVPGKSVQGTVDYSAGDATDMFKLTLPTVGDLVVEFASKTSRGEVTAEVEDPDGKKTPVKDGLLKLPGAQAGEYFVTVAANDIGAGGYSLQARYEAGDPDGQSGEDATQEGATVIDLADRSGRLKGSAKDEVDFDKQDATDWFRIDVPEEGKLSVVLKPRVRSSKVRAEFVKEEGDDDGERIRSGFSRDVTKKSYWVKVYAPEKGEATGYTLEVELTPNKFIDGVVVEIDRRSGCFLMVNKGTNHGVRNGVAANVMQGDTILASGVVDSAFPAISKVRMFGDCRYTPGSPVKIQDMSY